MIKNFLHSLDAIKKIKINQKKILINQTIYLLDFFEKRSLLEISDTYFSVFSQFNEDIILQYLIKYLKIKKFNFIEIGVENYDEANTRLILEKDNWNGMVIDSSKRNIEFIKSQDYYWRHSLSAINQFVTTENVNDIILENNFLDQVGVLSIDIDGNDLWVWDSIKVIKPDIVILEYNSKFGMNNSYSIKYDKNFKRNFTGIEKIIYGASLKALMKVSLKKSYHLVATNLNGNNAFFIREELLSDRISKINLEQAYRKSYFKEYLSKNSADYIDDEKLKKILLSSNLVQEI